MRSSDSPLTILELKDAVRSSDFESSAKMREWVQTVTGEHWKLLLTARKLAERSLKASPLEGDAYLVLAELAFLTDASGKLESKYIDQALQIRPFEVQTRYAAGQYALFAGDLTQVMHHWGFCYVRNPDDRLAIARIIVHMAESKSLLDQLQISWQDAGPLIVAYQEANQTEDARFLMNWVAEGAETAAEATPQMAHLWTIAFSRRVELGETDRAIDLLKRAINWHPALRKNLGLLLLEAGHSNEAIEHLKWAAMRSPDDAVVQTALKNAFDRGLMSEDVLAHEWEAQFE